MDNEGNQVGPIQLFNCKGCSELYTHSGRHESHHVCRQRVWKSLEHTSFGYYPNTPIECPYLDKK